MPLPIDLGVQNKMSNLKKIEKHRALLSDVNNLIKEKMKEISLANESLKCLESHKADLQLKITKLTDKEIELFPNEAYDETGTLVHLQFCSKSRTVKILNHYNHALILEVSYTYFCELIGIQIFRSNEERLGITEES